MRTPQGEPLAWLRSAININTDCCIPWPYHVGQGGYGYLSYWGRDQPAHRVSLILASGENPDDLVAAHSCKLRACVNPRHLSWKTQSENMLDRVRDGTDNRGEKHPFVKLSDQQVEEIKKDPRPQRAIAAEYGISQPTVSKLKLGQRRAHG